ncbi:rhodanese-like domain-containing protein [Sulfurimonas sp.]|uniref:rhodanese-like domain-containing protein n=1 Tax=Sulfurimonas sp. TaxID=2022749 RepID=UPI003567A607
MIKTLLSFIFLNAILVASMTNEYPSQKILSSNIPIVDIRTPPEWKETGIVKGAVTIMFFDETGGYDVQKFLNELNNKVDTKKPFALICRTGSRTIIVADFLSKQLGYDVINLLGGIEFLKARNLPVVPYNR